jgi:ribosome biogenesis GTPase
MEPLRAIGWPYPDEIGDPAWAALCAQHPGARPARVVAQHRSGFEVAEAPGEAVTVESPPEWQRATGYRKGLVAPEDRAAVGDWVLVEDGKIVALLPRHSAIKRAAAGEHYKQQMIAANIDTVFVVCGLDADFNPRRIERYLLLVQGSGAGAVVVLTKADKAQEVAPGAIAAAIAELRDVAGDTPVLALNAKDRDSAAALAPWLGAGRTVVLVGSSGAGKSTLTNSLLGSERMKTGEVRDSDDRGRHTTTHRALIALPSGACLIDTPGMRELKPTGEEAVADSFADVEELAIRCKFRDCRHASEPGCAVRAAIEAGTLSSERFASYLKLGGEVAGAAGQLASRRAQKPPGQKG